MGRDLNAMGREKLKKIVSFAVAGLVLALIAPSANARQVCNHDPVCQAKRDGVSVEQARSRQQQERRSGGSGTRAMRGDCRMKGTC
ncbi:MAG: hypothetical protein QOD11_499 [Bradyrhizobium sp.]|jgi:hypothetical protein|nr:hypothetical protein [Bradyrhizobium sp.]